MPDRSSITGPLTRLRNLFLQGIALLAPLALTIALIVQVGHSVETIVGALLKQLLPAGWHVPGLGLVVGLLLTLAAGLLANLFLVHWLLNLLERILDRIPLVKSLFKGLKDVSRFFEQGGDKQMGRPVSVTLPLGDGKTGGSLSSDDVGTSADAKGKRRKRRRRRDQSEQDQEGGDHGATPGAVA